MSLTRSDPSKAAAAVGVDRIRALVVDDSAVIRGMVSRWLEESGSVEVVGSVPDGERAIAEVASKAPDVVILDVEMPRMDGMTALPKILEADPDIKVIMASTLTQRNADISLRALSKGAADYIAKPSAREELHSEGGFRHELVEKVVALGKARLLKPRGTARVLPAADRGSGVRVRPEGGLYGKSPIVLRKPALIAPSLIAIGSSTGGPQALMKIMGELKGQVRQPVLITQHMPSTFTTILAQHITKVAGWPCTEAQDGEEIVAARAYLAPGDYHMTVEAGGSLGVLRLDQNPPENFCRPAVDPLFRSLATVLGAKVLGLVLTGMGHDGLAGGHALVEAGATIFAQDEASSIVWGMPGAVATGGLCSAVLPLAEIGPAVAKFSKGGGL